MTVPAPRPDKDGQKRTRGEQLLYAAKKANVQLRAQRMAAQQKAAEDHRRRVEAAAWKWKNERTEHLGDLIGDAARCGKFEWLVWETDLTNRTAEEREVMYRGFQLVAEWLTGLGIGHRIEDPGREQTTEIDLWPLRIFAAWDEKALAKVPPASTRSDDHA